MGDKGAEHLSDVLRDDTVIFLVSSFTKYIHIYFFTQALTTLLVKNNQIGDKGAEHLAAALGHDTMIFILSSFTKYARI